jgi:16S rRNA (cytosine967-C5)-methyltransferase
MTPGARIAAAAQVLDRVLAGSPAESALIAWARGSRYAGSGDRAAVRDLVFDALRRRRTAARAGGAESGRGLMLGLLRLTGQDPGALMTGQGHDLPPPGAQETGLPADGARAAEAADLPDWLWARLEADLGAQAADVAGALRERAPVFLRVNLRKGDRGAARAALAAEGVRAQAHPEVATALLVTDGARKVSATRAYLGGLVEVQDAASQAAVLALPLRDGMAVLDYCAGGGGKALAMAALADLRLTAHDSAPARMRDLAPRAARAGVAIAQAPTDRLPARGFDLVLVDAPCSGSGTWRRSPDAKWRLTPEGLAGLLATQAAILRHARELVRPGGVLAYATCSILREENDAQVAAFLAETPGWTQRPGVRMLPGQMGDGFYLAIMQAA